MPHWSGQAGVTYLCGNFATAQTTPASASEHNWVSQCVSVSSATTATTFVNGAMQSGSSAFGAPGLIGINSNVEFGTFGILEYMAWNRALSNFDLFTMQQYLARPAHAQRRAPSLRACRRRSVLALLTAPPRRLAPMQAAKYSLALASPAPPPLPPPAASSAPFPPTASGISPLSSLAAWYDMSSFNLGSAVWTSKVNASNSATFIGAGLSVATDAAAAAGNSAALSYISGAHCCLPRRSRLSHSYLHWFWC